eukprot:5980964-Amphidinium_carterae.2
MTLSAGSALQCECGSFGCGEFTESKHSVTASGVPRNEADCRVGDSLDLLASLPRGSTLAKPNNLATTTHQIADEVIPMQE